MPRNFTIGIDALIVQDKRTALINVEEEVQLASGIHDIVGDEIVVIIIKLALGDNIVPFHISIFIERKDHDIICIITGRLIAAPTIVAITVPAPRRIIGTIGIIIHRVGPGLPQPI